MRSKKYRLLNPLLVWFLSVALALVILAISLRSQFATFISADRSNIALIIFLLFLVAIVMSFVHALTLTRDFNFVGRLITDSPYQDSSYDWGSHEIARIMRISYMGTGTLTGKDLLGPYLARRNNIPNLISLLSSMLITLGLIGTVVGLIGAVGGLNSVIDGATYSESQLVDGIRETMASMGTAFYTTLFGAFLGGFTLRAVARVLQLSIDNVGGLLLEEIELNNSRAIEENLVKSEFELIGESASALIASFNTLKEQTDNFSEHMASNIRSTVNSQLIRLSQELRIVSESLENLKDR